VRVRAAILDAEPATRREAVDVNAALDELRAVLAGWRGMLRKETEPARRALTPLLAGRLMLTGTEQDGNASTPSKRGAPSRPSLMDGNPLAAHAASRRAVARVRGQGIPFASCWSGAVTSDGLERPPRCLWE